MFSPKVFIMDSFAQQDPIDATVQQHATYIAQDISDTALHMTSHSESMPQISEAPERSPSLAAEDSAMSSTPGWATSTTPDEKSPKAAPWHSLSNIATALPTLCFIGLLLVGIPCYPILRHLLGSVSYSGYRDGVYYQLKPIQSLDLLMSPFSSVTSSVSGLY